MNLDLWKAKMTKVKLLAGLKVDTVVEFQADGLKSGQSCGISSYDILHHKQWPETWSNTLYYRNQSKGGGMLRFWNIVVIVLVFLTYSETYSGAAIE